MALILGKNCTYYAWLEEDGVNITVVDKAPVEPITHTSVMVLKVTDLPGGTVGKLYGVSTSSKHYPVFKFMLENKLIQSEVADKLKHYHCTLETLLLAKKLYSQTNHTPPKNKSVCTIAVEKWLTVKKSRPVPGTKQELIKAIKELYGIVLNEAMSLSAIQALLSVIKMLTAEDAVAIELSLERTPEVVKSKDLSIDGACKNLKELPFDMRADVEIIGLTTEELHQLTLNQHRQKNKDALDRYEEERVQKKEKQQDRGLGRGLCRERSREYR